MNVVTHDEGCFVLLCIAKYRLKNYKRIATWQTHQTYCGTGAYGAPLQKRAIPGFKNGIRRFGKGHSLLSNLVERASFHQCRLYPDSRKISKSSPFFFVFGIGG